MNRIWFAFGTVLPGLREERLHVSASIAIYCNAVVAGSDSCDFAP